MPARLPMARLLSLTPYLALLQGCAAILGSKSTNVAAVSQPPGAEVYLDGARVGVTPDTISVESKKSHTMVLRLPGYKEDSCTLTSSVDGGWVILDVLLGGLVGIIVDAATSEWNELTKRSCNLVLTPANGANPAVVAAEPQRGPVTVTRPTVESFRSSTPDEAVSDGVRAERRTVVGDMLRTDWVTTVEQGPPGILRVGVGQRIHSSEGREFYFVKLASAYRDWTVEGHPLVIELWEGGRKIGEYTDQVFLIGAGYTTPLDCPENATTGLCGTLGRPLQQEPIPPTTESRPVPTGPRPEPSSDARARSGFHFGLGLGAGAMDLTCEGCDFPSETSFSGFLSLAGSVGEKTLLGVESTGWTQSESGTTSQVYSLMAHVTEYLNTTSGLFLRTGLGVVGYRADNDLSANAFGFSGRVGYELGTQGVVFVPYLGFIRTFGGAELKQNGDNVGFDFAISNFQVGLSIGAH